MLHILFQETKGAIFYPPTFFKRVRKAAWFRDPLVIEMVKDIDNVTVHGPSELVHPRLGELTIDDLSGGVKTLILLHMMSDTHLFDITACGENCTKWVAKMGREKELYVVLRYVMPFYQFDDPVHILNNDLMVLGDTCETFTYNATIWLNKEIYNVWNSEDKTFTTHDRIDEEDEDEFNSLS